MFTFSYKYVCTLWGPQHFNKSSHCKNTLLRAFNFCHPIQLMQHIMTALEGLLCVFPTCSLVFVCVPAGTWWVGLMKSASGPGLTVVCDRKSPTVCSFSLILIPPPWSCLVGLGQVVSVAHLSTLCIHHTHFSLCRHIDTYNQDTSQPQYACWVIVMNYKINQKKKLGVICKSNFSHIIS